MTRSKKLIFLASVLMVFIILTVVIQAVVNKDEEAASLEEDTSVTFMTVDAGTVTAISWTYNDETVSIALNDEGSWEYTEDEAFPVDQSCIDDMINSLLEVSASRSFESSDDSEYGLDEPAYTVVITSDTEQTLNIGEISEISGEYYASTGDGMVYLIDAELLDSFSYELSDVLEMESIPDMTTLTGIDITTKTDELSLVYLEDSDYAYTDSYTWFLEESGDYEALGDAADTLASDIAAMSWLSCESYNVTDEELETYGLDEPKATIVLTYTTEVESEDTDDEAEDTDETAEVETIEETFTIEIGGFTDGGYYVRIQGSNMVYLLDAALSQSLLNASYDELRPTDVCLMDWDTVMSFEVTLDDTVYTFERSTVSSTDDDGNITEEDIFLMDGEECDYDSVIAMLDSIYALSSTGTSTETAGDAEISFTFHRDTKTFTDIDLTFYRLDSTSCIVEFDGDAYLTVARTDIVSLVETVNTIILDQATGTTELDEDTEEETEEDTEEDTETAVIVEEDDTEEDVIEEDVTEEDVTEENVTDETEAVTEDDTAVEAEEETESEAEVTEDDAQTDTEASADTEAEEESEAETEADTETVTETDAE